ncbi:hypothetical protein [Nocardioides mangrovi]|uniref:Uncharacterized protein n=1 Tax=Nocardioides mangrovi TaxID=2874580 RepID=A0ABS7UF18_9ACTN|nr:hypothetical protein [Nocardioides mangrovi]MBZ5739440.1 hypothetical protein [Nocardioides mangrovi]
MSFDPIAAQLAVKAARATAGSARPDAPVQPDRHRTRRGDALRTRVARGLHSVARRVEPAPRRTPQVG